VIREGLSGFDSELANRLELIAGIQTVVPVIQTPAALVGKSGPVPILALGVIPEQDTAARDYHLRQGKYLGAEDGVLLEAGFARSQGIESGGVARFLTPAGAAKLPVVGLLDPRGAAAFNGGAVAFLPLPTAQRLFQLPGQVNSLQLVLRSGAAEKQIEDELAEQLPTGFTVQSPGARAELGRTGMAPTEQGLATMSASSLVAGAFVILNAFLMNLGERRRQLALLRALGATRGQVTRLLLREAALLGVAGTILGIGLGFALSSALRGTIGRLMAVTLPELGLSVEPVLVALVVGPGMALSATFVPARRAGRRPPLEDLLQKGGSYGEEFQRWPSYVGLALLAGLCVILHGILHGWLEPHFFMHVLPPAMAMYLIGCALLIPLLLGPISRFAKYVLQLLLGNEGMLAVRQLSRRRTRTSLTAGVLMVATVFAIGFGQTYLNSIDHIRDWFKRIIATDFYVRAAWPDPTVAITTAPIPESLAGEIARLDGVDHIGKFNFILTRAHGRSVVILAFSASADRPLALLLAEGEARDVHQRFLQGEVVLGTALAQRLELKPGDSLNLETREGIRQLRIAGTAVEYTGGGMALYLDWNAAKKYFDLQGVHAILITAQMGKTRALAETLQNFCREKSLLLQSNLEVRETLDQQLAGFLGIIWILLSLVFVVASLGIVNTLTMNVLEQTRELGVLRAIGMKRRQIAKMILAQALALAIISLIPGTLAGIGLAYLTNLSTYPVTGQRVPLHLEASFVLGCFGLALVIAVSAAFFPARRAVRLQVIEALQYE